MNWRPLLLVLLLPATAAIALAASLSGGDAAVPAPRAMAPACAVPGSWLGSTSGASGGALSARDASQVIAQAATRPVVLLGERHDSADHHRWQLQVLAALHARRPSMVIGFEMFPRRVQPVLDRWVAGELSEADFLRLSEWDQIWGFDPQLYLPMFHFARLNRIPMVALNVERALVRAVAVGGWDSVPAERREGVGRPAPPPDAYVSQLRSTFELHLPPPTPGASGTPGRSRTDSDASFGRFLDAQLTWDRAMAEALARHVRSTGGPLVVGVMGSGHLQFGHGVPHQLAALGIADPYVMIPFDASAPDACEKPPAAIAQAVFVVPPATAAPAPVRLGVALGTGEGAPRIDQVGAGSLAERSGLRVGDRIVRVAGQAVASAAEVTAAIRAQPAGTILPIVVQRDGREIEVLVRFPVHTP
jgi:uncharacterized iron-regulated protein